MNWWSLKAKNALSPEPPRSVSGEAHAGQECLEAASAAFGVYAAVLRQQASTASSTGDRLLAAESCASSRPIASSIQTASGCFRSISSVSVVSAARHVSTAASSAARRRASVVIVRRPLKCLRRSRRPARWMCRKGVTRRRRRPARDRPRDLRSPSWPRCRCRSAACRGEQPVAQAANQHGDVGALAAAIGVQLVEHDEARGRWHSR